MAINQPAISSVFDRGASIRGAYFPGAISMRGCFRSLRVLIPAGVVSHGSLLARKTHAQQESKEGDSNSSSSGGRQQALEESLGTQLAKQLEAWLLPADKAGSVGAMVGELRDALAEETHMSPEESRRLPVNLLMLKAMHERELLEAKHHHTSDRLDREDRKIIARAAHFSQFATAAYGIMGNLPRLQAIVAKETSIPPPDRMMNERDYLQRWFISKHTGIDLEDVKQVDTSGSVETRAYFVAVDHSTRSVVLSIRGTFSLSDAIVDLLCKSVDFGSGKAHKGISQSAVSVWATVKDEVEGILREHKDYQLVLTGHSLGAGTAILLKHLFDDSWNLRRRKRARGASVDGSSSQVRLDVGRRVHVECYAFAPPPVFKGKGAEKMPDTFSFVHRFDCIPTASLGSLYSLFRTIRRIDQLPLGVYERAAYVLDSRVRVQRRKQGLDAKVEKDERAADKLANNILDLTRTATSRLSSGEDTDAEIEAPFGGSQASSASRTEISTSDAAGDVEGKNTAVDEDVWKTISNIEGDLTRFTKDIKNAAEDLRETVDKAGETMERFYDSVGRVTSDVLRMSPEEIALTALLVQRLAAGGEHSPDEVHSMVRRCEEEGRRPGKDALHSEVTVGDLIIPGKVYFLRGVEVAAAAAGVDSGRERRLEGDGYLGGVRRTSSAELGGIRLCNSMMDDHFMGGYEPALLAATQRFRD